MKQDYRAIGALTKYVKNTIILVGHSTLKTHTVASVKSFIFFSFVWSTLCICWVQILNHAFPNAEIKKSVLQQCVNKYLYDHVCRCTLCDRYTVNWKFYLVVSYCMCVCIINHETTGLWSRDTRPRQSGQL